MDPEFRGDADHHDGTSDATPGGYEGKRRPGEVVFALILLAASALMLREALGIRGFGKLSAPATIPVATTAVMVICMAIVVLRTLRLPIVSGETIRRDILPIRVLVFVAMLGVYALLLVPFGFLPTTALFLIAGIRILGRSWGFSIGMGLAALLGIWVVFRIVFTVLMPAGVFPEAELVQFFRNTFGGSR
jgi:putative tricarboxylic transport membrane protein